MTEMDEAPPDSLFETEIESVSRVPVDDIIGGTHLLASGIKTMQSEHSRIQYELQIKEDKIKGTARSVVHIGSQRIEKSDEIKASTKRINFLPHLVMIDTGQQKPGKSIIIEGGRNHISNAFPLSYDGQVVNETLVCQSLAKDDDPKIQNLPLYRIGYWWSEKKNQRLNGDYLSALFAERRCEFIKLDFDLHLDQQGPFDVIVHKMSDILVKADQGDTTAKKTISAFESYVRKHPLTVVLDPIDKNRALLDRYKQYRLIEQCELAKENVVFTPPFVHLTSTNIDVNRGRIRRSQVTFPIVCKPILAQGSTGAHQMCIIFNEAGLKDVRPPCVAQSFVNHNAKLFKIFVIKEKYHMIERPSLKNFHDVAENQETIFFYSHDISKPNSSSSLTELDEIDEKNLRDLLMKWQENGAMPPLAPDSIILDKIVKIFNEKLGLTFYGVDIIIESGTSRYAIIDMNTFPGYDGVENFHTIFCDIVCDAIPKDAANNQPTKLYTKRKQTEHDSGIEST